MANENLPKIRWAPPLRTSLLKKLYDSDAAGIQDSELCDEVGIALYARCETFAHVREGTVECPVCGSVFPVSKDGTTRCPTGECDWSTTWSVYGESLRNYGAHPGRALAAYDDYLRAYPGAGTYRQKILLIDQLIHRFHIDENTGNPVKSIASKLLEGNKKAVVRFLDELSEIDPDGKTRWRRDMAMTIDRRIVRRDDDADG
jgi:hypothetical protein